MPLSDSVDRELVHDRTIVCRGWRRNDGLWDIEGNLVDTKTYSFPNEFRGEVKAGEPIHDMWLRLTVDMELNVIDAEACTDSGPFDICPGITPNFKKLKGLRIGPGWRGKIKELLGGAHGCTHLVELLGPIATTAYQTLYGEKARMAREAKARGEEPENANYDPNKKPRLLNSCHAFNETGPVVKVMYPEWYTGPADAPADADSEQP